MTFWTHKAACISLFNRHIYSSTIFGTHCWQVAQTLTCLLKVNKVAAPLQACMYCLWSAWNRHINATRINLHASSILSAPGGQLAGVAAKPAANHRLGSLWYQVLDLRQGALMERCLHQRQRGGQCQEFSCTQRWHVSAACRTNGVYADNNWGNVLTPGRTLMSEPSI